MRLFIFLISFSLYADTLLTSSINTMFFQNKLNKSEVALVKGQILKTYNLQLNKFVSEFGLQEPCQNTDFLWVGKLLISKNRTCILKDGIFREAEARDENPFEFSITYLKETSDSYLFVLNKREFFENEFGEFILKTVDKRSGQASYETMYDQIPGFSGALKSVGNDLYYVIVEGYEENYLYKTSIDNFLDFKLSSPIPGDLIIQFEGLSFELWMQENKILVDNSNAYGSAYDSLLIQDDTVKTGMNKCHIVGTFKSKWIVNCKGKLQLKSVLF